MNLSIKSLSCILVASFSLTNIGAVWSDNTEAKKTDTKVVTHKAKAKTKKKAAKAAVGTTPAKPAISVAPDKTAAPTVVPAAVSTSAAPVAATPVNPYLPKPAPVEASAAAKAPAQTAPTAAAVAPVNPYMPRPVQTTAPTANPTNPYLTSPVATTAIAAPTVTAPVATAAVPAVAAPARTNPYLPQPSSQQSSAPEVPYKPLGNPFSGIGSLLPSLPSSEESLLPHITKVYPTGEKPLVVLTFKCPAEMVGLNTPIMKGLHGAVNAGMDAINYTNLLSFNLQQVCQ